ncbi:unnamed protein product [Paramecium octaurelia]|uniref:Uncharacterized protein n=1 Tax=Paramecium octaurelia TaxID=43137 RepID=A0A8S1WQJ5_PAROT|nr:unnamed protein product [Paramecium octaurelia]
MLCLDKSLTYKYSEDTDLAISCEYVINNRYIAQRSGDIKCQYCKGNNQGENCEPQGGYIYLLEVDAQVGLQIIVEHVRKGSLPLVVQIYYVIQIYMPAYQDMRVVHKLMGVQKARSWLIINALHANLDVSQDEDGCITCSSEQNRVMKANKCVCMNNTICSYLKSLRIAQHVLGIWTVTQGLLILFNVQQIFMINLAIPFEQCHSRITKLTSIILLKRVKGQKVINVRLAFLQAKGNQLYPIAQLHTLIQGYKNAKEYINHYINSLQQ